MKKLLAILLSALLLLPLGLALRSGDASAETEADLWAQIERYENDRLAARGVNVTTASADDYMSMTDGIVALVEAHESYAPGTLFLNGQSVFWHDTNGMGNGWVPNARQKQRANLTGKTPEEAASVETVSYASKGGSPNSSDVALFGPYYGSDSSFTNQYRNEANSIAQASGGVYRLYSGTAATIDAIAHELETSGIVIFDSHGNTDYSTYSGDYTSRANTSYLCLTSYEGLTNQDTATVQGTFGSYQHAFRSGNGAFVDGTAIANHMDGVAPNSLLWMAICLGMATDGMEAPLRAQGVEVVYGYSQSVTFAGDYKWEAYFWEKMKAGSDVAEAVAYEKEKVGYKDPYTSSYPAYPIVVSSEDPYPGQGNVDAKQDVYSSWTMFPQFNVTAVANDPSLGTVTVSGTSVIATPNTGVAVTGYELLSGTAKVSQNGDGLSRTVFSVRAESDCSLKIIFTQRQPANATFVTPAGVSCAAISGYVGDTITLPQPSGKPTADDHSYGFYGWVETRIPDTDTRPDCMQPGDRVVLTENRTFYALYSYATQNGAPVPAGTFLLLVAEPADWSGEAVLTYDGKVVLSANSSSSQIGTQSAADPIGSTGIIVVADALTNVPDTYIYTIESVGGGNYTLRMKGSANRYYLCYNANNDKLAATKSVVVQSGKSAAYWSLSWKNGKPVFTNNQTPSATLCYDTEKQCFSCKKNNPGASLKIYTVSDSSLCYTTELGNAPAPTPTPTPTPSASPSASPAVDPKATVEWNAEDVELKGSTPYLICDGTAKTPRFTVKAEDGSVIDPTDYDFEYRENTNAGTAYVIVTFKNAYTGTAQGWFKIYLPATDYTMVENRDDGVYMEWNAVEGADGYVIYRRAWSSTTNGWTDFVRWNNTPDLFWTDTQVYAGTRYQYGIKAYFDRRVDPVSGAEIGGNVGDNYNLGIVGPLKTTVRITTRTLNSVTGGNKQITAKWGASKNFTGYELEIATDELFTQNVQTVTITDYKTAAYTFKNLSAKTTYYVRVRSYHEFDGMTYFGGWSNVLSAKTN